MTDVFVEADALGNELVAEFLARHNISEAESLCHDQLCADKKRRDVWRIKSSYAKRFEHAAKQFPHITFVFYVRKAPDAPLSKIPSRGKKTAVTAKSSRVPGVTASRQ